MATCRKQSSQRVDNVGPSLTQALLLSIVLVISYLSRICSDVGFSLLRYAIDKTLRRVVLLYSVLPCRRLSSDCRHVRHKPTIKPRSGGVLTLTIDYRSNQFNHLHMTGARVRHPCPPQYPIKICDSLRF